MWLQRSVVVWLYALSLIPSVFALRFSPFLFFLLHLYLLHLLTKSYLIRKRELSALRCRFLTGCILSPPVQFFFLTFLGALLTFVASFVYFAVHGYGEDPEAAKAAAEEFQTWLNTTIQGTVEAMSTSELTPTVIAVRTVSLSSTSAWETFVAWLLTKGYSTMVTTIAEGQVTVETITATDIFTFALVGILGMRVGNSIIGSFLALSRQGRILQPWWEQLFIIPAVQLVRLGQALVSVGIFSILACANALEFHVNTAGLVVAALGVNVVVNVADWFWSPEGNRFFGFVAWCVSAAVLFAAGNEVWKRFRVFRATEISRRQLREGVAEPLKDDAGSLQYTTIA